MSKSGDENQGESLGNPAQLNKIDQLRRLNISSVVPLPQLVVVGDQSGGKSSVLESLTGFPFPRAVNLCTRYATEIICRRDDTESITAFIRPAANASADRAAKLSAFKVVLPALDRNNKVFQDVFHQASTAMGLRSGSDPSDSAPAFSEDVLRIEITGPSEVHLTIIDVPGVFPPIPEFVYFAKASILAAVPCTHDIATQQILKRAEEVDPKGVRTIGVLTKPDLLTEKATKNAIVDLVRGRRKDLKLGYFVIRNRGADDATSDLNQRNNVERAFFSESPWNRLDKSRLDVESLRLRLRELLINRTKHDFPIVKREASILLKENKRRLNLMGEARISADQQRAYLGHIADGFADLGRYALDAYYTGHPIFNQQLELRLVTRIREISEAFAKTLFSRGHSHEFQKEGEPTNTMIKTAPETVTRNDLYEISFDVPDEHDFPELQGSLAEPFFCPCPVSENITDHIRGTYLDARGQELGTFGNSMLPIAFKEQSNKWRDLTLAHVSNAILIVHHFIDKIMVEACPEGQVRDGLWAFLQDDLLNCYRRVVEHAEFLLHVECEGKAITCNPDFTNSLMKNREKRQKLETAEADKMLRNAQECGRVVSLAEVRATMAKESDTIDQICGDVHDVLKAYYEVARSRFVDEIYQQVVDHFLLSGDQSPLRVMTKRIRSLSNEQLKSIAEEDFVNQQTRMKLEREIANLEEAIVILRN
ncbi:dynamin family protein [Hypoxylon crocopeplum]|nr:dynamin family protein [Hypoxylon crocopeplum]